MCCITVNPAEYVKWAEAEIAEANKRIDKVREEYRQIRAEYDAKSAWYRFWHTKPGDGFCDYTHWDLHSKHKVFCTDEAEKYLPAADYAVQTGVEFQIPSDHDFFGSL